MRKLPKIRTGVRVTKYWQFIKTHLAAFMAADYQLSIKTYLVAIMVADC